MAIHLTTLLCFDLRLQPVGQQRVVIVVIVLQGVVGLDLGLFRRRHQCGSYEESRTLAFSMAIVAVGVFVVAQIERGGLVSRTVPVLAAFLALVLAAVVLYAARVVEDRLLHPSSDRTGEHDVRPNHPLINQMPVTSLSIEDARAACSLDGRSTVTGPAMAIATGRGIDVAGTPAAAAGTAAPVTTYDRHG